MKNRKLLIPACAVLMAVSGCAVGPDYQRPDAPMTEAFKATPNWKIADPVDDVAKGEWWKIYRDPVLDELMTQVVPNNQNIAIYVARVRQAQALVGGAQAARYPTIGINGNGGRIGSSNNSSNLYNPDGSINDGVISNYVNFQLQASWDSDLWGKLRRNLESQDANYVASVADLENAKLSMQIQLAQAYFTIRSQDSLKVLLDNTTTQNKRSVEITRNAFEVGVKARQDLINASMQYKSVEAQLIDVEVNRAAQEAIVATLIGKPASDFSIKFNPLPGRASIAVPVVPTGLPSALLERRPDIAAAERRMASANAQIGYQMAAFFPSLTLNVANNNIGYSGTSFSHLFTGPFLFWGLGPNIALTLLDFGARSAKVEQARGIYDENVATYRQTVLTALQDVETQLAALRVLEQEATVQDEASDLSEKGVTIALNRYRAGIAGYTDVVVAVNQALANQQKSILIAQQRLNASVLLVKALGGGWDKPAQAGQRAAVSPLSEREPKQNSEYQQAQQRPDGKS
jgi:NodT family efflux transporter outer membrane factor (OMF) lipoprotein